MTDSSTFEYWPELLPEMRGVVVTKLDDASRTSFGMTSTHSCALARASPRPSRELLWTEVVGRGFNKLFRLFYCDLAWFGDWGDAATDLILDSIAQGFLGFRRIFTVLNFEESLCLRHDQPPYHHQFDTTELSFAVGKAQSKRVMDYFVDRLGVEIDQENFIHGLIAVDAVSAVAVFDFMPGGTVPTEACDDTAWESYWDAMLTYGAVECVRRVLVMEPNNPFRHFVLSLDLAVPPNGQRSDEILDLIYAQKSPSSFTQDVLSSVFTSMNPFAARWALSKTAAFNPNSGIVGAALTVMIHSLEAMTPELPFIFDWMEVVWNYLDMRRKYLGIRRGFEIFAARGDLTLAALQKALALANATEGFPWKIGLRMTIFIAAQSSLQSRRLLRYLFSLDELVNRMDGAALLEFVPGGGYPTGLQKKPHEEIVAFCRESLK